MDNNMEKFIGENGKVFIALSHELSEEEALRIANRHFKVKKDTLCCEDGYMSEEYLYFEPTEGTELVWAVSKA